MRPLIRCIVYALAASTVIAKQTTTPETTSVDISSLMSHLATATALPPQIRSLAARETQAYSNAHSHDISETSRPGILARIFRRSKEDKGVAVTTVTATVTAIPTTTTTTTNPMLTDVPSVVNDTTCKGGIRLYDYSIPATITATGDFNVFVIITYSTLQRTWTCQNYTTRADNTAPTSTLAVVSTSSNPAPKEKRVNASDPESFVLPNLQGLTSKLSAINEKIAGAPNVTSSSSYSSTSTYFNPHSTETGLVSSDSSKPQGTRWSNSTTPVATPTMSATPGGFSASMTGTMTLLRPDFTPKMRNCTPKPSNLTGTIVGHM